MAVDEQTETAAGRELDALIAEKVIGLPRELISINGPITVRGILTREIDHYSTDIAAAWEVIGRVREWPERERYSFTMRLRWIIEDRIDRNVTESNVILYAEPVDICRAALKAMEAV